jgi:hypothetical protein
MLADMHCRQDTVSQLMVYAENGINLEAQHGPEGRV